MRRIDARRFSLAEFYRRRIKRIAPAMLVVVLATLIVSRILLLPEDGRDTAKSAFWSLAFAANIYFWREEDNGYFAASSEQLPLLHLWSLAVEEQFYLIWPLVLLALYRAGRGVRLSVMLGLVAILSFWLGEVAFGHNPLFAYYQLPTRAGELLLGAFVAFQSLRPNGVSLGRAPASVLAVAGTSLLLAPMFLLSETSRFPGWGAVPPTLGTALVILAGLGTGTPVSRVLGSRAMVWVGKLSYSAYLWHWPLLAFYRYGYGEVRPVAGVMIFVSTFLLAWTTYLLVEQPVRESRASVWQVLRRSCLIPAGTMAGAVLLIVYGERAGLPLSSTAYRDQLEVLRAQASPAFQSERVCQSRRATPSELTNPDCVVGAATGAEPSILLWGDSNAAHYVGMIDVFGKAGGFSVRNVQVDTCPPVDGDPSPFLDPRQGDDCRISLQLLRPFIDSYDTIILSASWDLYDRHSSTFLPRVFDTVDRLTSREGRRIVLIGKVPEVAGYDRLCSQKVLRFPWLACPAIVVPPDPELLLVNERLRAFADTRKGVEYLDATEQLCPLARCSSIDEDGSQRYFDASHLTMAASELLGLRIVKDRGVPEAFVGVAQTPLSSASRVSLSPRRRSAKRAAYSSCSARRFPAANSRAAAIPDGQECCTLGRIDRPTRIERSSGVARQADARRAFKDYARS